MLKWLSEANCFGELHALEISASGVERIRERGIPSLARVELFDGYRIPYPDGHFDLAYSTHVIEHVEHPRLFLRELSRVSRHQIAGERLTRLAPEVIRYNWYKNEKRAYAFAREAKLSLRPLRDFWKRLVRGRAHAEFEFDALTVLTRAVGSLRIFDAKTE